MVDAEFTAGLRVGILGGGQLAKMLAEAASPLGLDVAVFTETPGDAAALVVSRSVAGAFDDEEALSRFLAGCDVVVYENEWVDAERLQRLAARYPAVAFRPPLATLEALRDKARQKRIVESLGIPTAPFVVRPQATAPDRWLEELAERFAQGYVLKWAQHGYDGKGVLFVDKPAAPPPSAVAFCREAESLGATCFAEERVAFRRELAVLGCRSLTGELAIYPLLVSEQEGGICVRLVGPASALGVSDETEQAAREYVTKLAEATEIVGCFAIELFELPDGQILVNEIAPRVHNSGHVTQEAAATSQYENHWRAALGLPLGAVTMAPAFAMRNLLGPAGVRLERDIPLPFPGPRQHLHWYRKADLRPRRKVGHLNAVGAAPGDIPALVRDLEATVEEWNERVRRVAEGKGSAS